MLAATIFIDAARDPDPGRGILRDMAGQALPGDGYDCVNQQALAKLIGRYLKPNFATVYGAIRSHPLNAATPISLNSYDADGAQRAGRPGTGQHFADLMKNPSTTPTATEGIFRAIGRP